MASPKQRAECSIELMGQKLDLEFKSYNMLVLTDNTGKTPIDYLSRFEGMASGDLAAYTKTMCDFAFIVPLIVAGLAKHPEFERTDALSLKKKICKMLDAEAEKRGTSLLPVIAEVAAKVVPAAVLSLNFGNESEEPDPKNEATPAAKEAVGVTEILTGDA